MQKSRLVIQSALMAMALGNGIPARTEPTPVRVEQRQKKRKLGMSDLFSKPYGNDASIRKHNEEVDRKKNARLKRRLDNLRKNWKVAQKKDVPAAPNSGTDVRSLITSYQMQSHHIRTPYNLQHKAEFERRTPGRSHDGVAAEAKQLTNTRAKRTGKVSDAVGGRATRVVIALANIQQGRIDALNEMNWAAWEPTESANIWHHNELDVYMFSDEKGDLFVRDPGTLCFLTKELAEQALQGYIKYLGSEQTEEDLKEQLQIIGTRASLEVHAAETECNHQLYKDGDVDIPDAIKDRNGQVVLDMCKVCGKAEAELNDNWEEF